MTWTLLLAPLALGAVVLPCLAVPLMVVGWLCRRACNQAATAFRSVKTVATKEVSR